MQWKNTGRRESSVSDAEAQFGDHGKQTALPYIEMMNRTDIKRYGMEEPEPISSGRPPEFRDGVYTEKVSKNGTFSYFLGNRKETDSFRTASADRMQETRRTNAENPFKASFFTLN